MNLRDEILKEHSRANTERIANWVGDNEARFGELMELFLKGEYRVTQRAAWIVLCCAEANPELVKPYIGKMIKRASEPGVHQAVARNVTGVLQFIDIPKKDLGNAVNFCFNALVEPQTPIAVQANAMTVLTNVCKHEPDLKHELQTAIETLMVNGSAAIKARGKRSLAALKKVVNRLLSFPSSPPTRYVQTRFVHLTRNRSRYEPILHTHRFRNRNGGSTQRHVHLQRRPVCRSGSVALPGAGL